MSKQEIEVGDQVWVKGEVVKHEEGVGYKVETFSKTDQYHAWVREDLVAKGVIITEDTASYAAVALEGSSDNGDQYCASQIREAMEVANPTPEFDLGEKVRYIGNGPVKCWDDRREDKHLCIVVQHMGDGVTMVWDTVEQGLWSVKRNNLALHEGA